MKREETTRVWRTLFEATDWMRNINAGLIDQTFLNLTFNQLRMIKIVYVLNREFPEGVTLKVLAESLNITPAAASEMRAGCLDLLRRRDKQAKLPALSLSPAHLRDPHRDPLSGDHVFHRRVFRLSFCLFLCGQKSHAALIGEFYLFYDSFPNLTLFHLSSDSFPCSLRQAPSCLTCKSRPLLSRRICPAGRIP